MKNNIEYVRGISEGIDFDKTYKMAGWGAGIAWTILGWEPKWEPCMMICEDENGDEYEENAGDGEWIPDIGGRIASRMVGDDSISYFDPEDLTPLNAGDFCHECGQIACTANTG